MSSRKENLLKSPDLEILLFEAKGLAKVGIRGLVKKSGLPLDVW